MTGFQLLWCERCGKADTGKPPDLPDFVIESGPLVCSDCNEPITLLDAQTAAGGIWTRGRWTYTASDMRRMR